MLQALVTPNSIPVTIRFEDGEGPALSVRTLDAQFAMSALFSMRVLVTAADSDFPLRTLVGRKVLVGLPDGVTVNGFLYRASHHAGEVANGIVLDIGSHLWALTQSFDEYTWEQENIISIAKDFLENIGFSTAFEFEISSPPEPGPYTALFEESDHDALFRLLAEDGIASFFDATLEGSPFVMTNDTVASSAKRARRLPFYPPTQLGAAGSPHIHSVEVTAQGVIDMVELRDYWFERPEFEAAAPAHLTPSNAWSQYDRSRLGTGLNENVLKRRARDVLDGFAAGQEIVRLKPTFPCSQG